MIAGLGLGQDWSPLWGPPPRQPYAVLECSTRRAARRVRENASIEDPFSSAAHRAATRVGDARLVRQLRLVAGSQVAVPPLWVLQAWVDAHFERCERSWAACLDDVLDSAEAAGRPVRAGDLHAIGHLPAAVRWAARCAPVSVVPARSWRVTQRTAWHEAGHAVIAWHHQVRYEPLLLDASLHLGGYGEGSLSARPEVAPTGVADGSPGWSDGEVFVHHAWLSAGMAAEELFACRPGAGGTLWNSHQRADRCTSPHLEEAAAIIRSHEGRIPGLIRYLLDHGGAGRRHLRALLGPRGAVVARSPTDTCQGSPGHDDRRGAGAWRNGDRQRG